MDQKQLRQHRKIAMAAVTEHLGDMRLHIQTPQLITGDIQRRFTHQLGSLSVLIRVTVDVMSADTLNMSIINKTRLWSTLTRPLHLGVRPACLGGPHGCQAALPYFRALISTCLCF